MSIAFSEQPYGKDIPLRLVFALPPNSSVREYYVNVMQMWYIFALMAVRGGAFYLYRINEVVLEAYLISVYRQSTINVDQSSISVISRSGAGTSTIDYYYRL